MGCGCNDNKKMSVPQTNSENTQPITKTIYISESMLNHRKTICSMCIYKNTEYAENIYCNKDNTLKDDIINLRSSKCPVFKW